MIADDYDLIAEHVKKIERENLGTTICPDGWTNPIYVFQPDVEAALEAILRELEQYEEDDDDDVVVGYDSL